MGQKLKAQMGYWENTTFVKTHDPLTVLAALERLFRKEGMQRIEPPQRPERYDYEPMQYAPALENDLWGIAAFPGKEPWTIIKTAPLELLAERPPGGLRIRLSDLCRDLSTVEFQIHVYDGASILLCEVVESGDV